MMLETIASSKHNVALRAPLLTERSSIEKPDNERVQEHLDATANPVNPVIDDHLFIVYAKESKAY